MAGRRLPNQITEPTPLERERREEPRLEAAVEVPRDNAFQIELGREIRAQRESQQRIGQVVDMLDDGLGEAHIEHERLMHNAATMAGGVPREEVGPESLSETRGSPQKGLVGFGRVEEGGEPVRAQDAPDSQQEGYKSLAIQAMGQLVPLAINTFWLSQWGVNAPFQVQSVLTLVVTAIAIQLVGWAAATLSNNLPYIRASVGSR